MIFTAPILDMQHERDSVKEKAASLLVVFLGYPTFFYWQTDGRVKQYIRHSDLPKNGKQKYELTCKEIFNLPGFWAF